MPKPKRNADAPQTQEEKILVDIEKFGWTVILVEGTDYLPTFAYTIGLFKNYKHPEIIAFGLDLEILQDTLNSIGEGVKSGATIESRKNYPEIFEESRTEFVKVDPRNIEDYFGYAVDYYEEIPFPALELVWTDENDNFPWDSDYSEGCLWSQPLLDRNAEFKFSEDPNLEVFVDSRFLSEGKLVTKVLHDDEGEWYFHTNDSVPEDIRKTRLDTIIQSDASLNETFQLDYGEQATRRSKTEAWTKSKI